MSFPSITALLDYRAHSFPGRIAFSFLESGDLFEISYAALASEARAIASVVAAHVVPGDRVLVSCVSERDFIAGYLGCLLASAIPVPSPAVDQRRLQSTVPRVASIVEDCGARLAIIGPDHKGSIQAAMRPFAACLPVDVARQGSSGAWRPQLASPDDIALLQYTSGSTSSPRGVVLTHRNLLCNVEAIRLATRQGPESIGVGWLPLYHDMGLIGTVLFPLFAGFAPLLFSPLAFLKRPLLWLELISELRATITVAPNFGYEMCVRAASAHHARRSIDLSSLQVALNGAELVKPSTLRRFSQRFGPVGFKAECFQACYGLAEASLLVTSGRYLEPSSIDAVSLERVEADGECAPELEHPGLQAEIVSCGRPQGGATVAIAARDEPRARRAEGQIGEIMVGGPSLARGYWRCNEPSSTLFEVHLADGSGPYFPTGDLGFMRGGELYFVGRLKDLLVLSGRNLYACDIEQTICEVDEQLNAERGLVFSADDASSLVILREIERSVVRGTELAAAIRERVACRHQVGISAVVLVQRGSLPTTSSGKVRRVPTENDYRCGRLKVVAQWSRSASAGIVSGHEDIGVLP